MFCYPCSTRGIIIIIIIVITITITIITIIIIIIIIGGYTLPEKKGISAHDSHSFRVVSRGRDQVNISVSHFFCPSTRG